MIVAHLFEREDKHVRKLMLDSSSTKGVSPISGGVEELMVIKDSDSLDTVIGLAKIMIMNRNPDIEFIDVLENTKKSENGKISFDLAFRPRKSLLEKWRII